MRDIPFDICLKLIHAFEKGPDGSFAATPYQDSGGLWTNGWGHRCEQDAPVIDAAQADQQARMDLTRATAGVCAAVGAAIADLNDGQYAALIDFTYNVGTGVFLQSTLCRLVVAGNHVQAALEFPKWVYGKVDGVETKLPGLVRRRKAELDCWTI